MVFGMTTKGAGIALAFVALATAASAQQPRVTDEHVQELIRLAAERAGVSAQAGGLPQAVAATAANERPVVHLALDDAIKLALDRNLDISVQRLNPQTFDY